MPALKAPWSVHPNEKHMWGGVGEHRQQGTPGAGDLMSTQCGLTAGAGVEWGQGASCYLATPSLAVKLWPMEEMDNRCRSSIFTFLGWCGMRPSHQWSKFSKPFRALETQASLKPTSCRLRRAGQMWGAGMCCRVVSLGVWVWVQGYRCGI